jgi:energy-coupling factor transport system permease protein
MKRSFASQAWVIWVVVMAVITLMIRNPFYIIILLLTARLVQTACAVTGSEMRFHFWRLASIIVLASTVFNMLMVHIGQTVLFALPENWWLVGGAVTLEATIYGAISGLILVTLLALFLAFNAVVPPSELIRLTPRAVADIGLTVMIAVTYVPETLEQLKRIKEAQALRGHRIRGVRDWRPVVIPLMVGGLERAMGLAETMVSRGYGATSEKRHSARIQVALITGLLLTFAGWLLTFWFGPLGWIMLIGGVALVVGLFVWLGRQVAHTRYRSRSWNRWDWSLAILGLVPLALIFIPFPFVDRSTLFYTPYLLATVPPFDILLGLGLALLAAPAILVEL